MREEFSLPAWTEKLRKFHRRSIPLPRTTTPHCEPSSSGGVLHKIAKTKHDQNNSICGSYFPDDLFHTLLSFMDTTSLSRAACVCKLWREVSAQEDFWRCLNFKNRNISEQRFSNICRRYPNANQLNLYGIPHQISLLSIAGNCLESLDTLIVGGISQLNLHFFLALTLCPALTTLKVIDANFNKGSTNSVLVQHVRLQNLHITNCKGSNISVTVRCPRLEILSMKGSEMTDFEITCPLLRQLDVSSCDKLPDLKLRTAATSCPLLTSLDISDCSNVTEETISQISQQCTRLQSLIVLQCEKISFISPVNLPRLKFLMTSTSSVDLVSRFHLLEVLELDGCASLESITLRHKKLQTIRLRNCHELSDIKLQTPMLSSITISSCPSLHQISLSTNSLQKLVLQRQEALINLELNCSVLQAVEIKECNSLVSFVYDDGSCPALTSLVLDRCKNLTAVKVCSTSVVSFSIVGCCAMIALELACPYLEKVHLNDCDHLEIASFSPVGLLSLNLGMCPKLRTLQIDAPQMVLLELMGCGVLSNASIHCPLIKLLNASFCRELTDNSIRKTAASCPLIKSLVLSSCLSVGPISLSSLRGLQHLTLLDMSYSNLTDLRSIFECCLQLEVLKIQACKYLTDSSLETLYREGVLPALTELDLSYGNFSQSTIGELLTQCTHLRHVSLNGCANIDYFNGTSPSQDITEPNHILESLNMVGCPNIKQVVIPAVSFCESLSSLNLSLSVNLRVVENASVTLSVLNLSRCCSLEILKLDCPRLSSLILRSCSIAEEVLEAAISHSSMLETLDVRCCPQIHYVSDSKLHSVCPSLKSVLRSSSIS